MEVVKNKNENEKNPLTLAEKEACQQFEASDRAGQALFHPRVAAGKSAPNCVVFCEEVGRFGITILEGRYSVEEARTEDEQWYRHESDGTRTPIDNPLEGAWQAAAEVREELKRKLDLKLYTIAVAWFPDMEPDEDILDAAAGGSAHPLFGRGDLVQRLVKLPDSKELQPQLNDGYIKQEITALSRASTATAGAAAPPEAEAPPSVKGRVGALVLERVEIVNIDITIVYGGDGGDPPLITVQGQ